MPSPDASPASTAPPTLNLDSSGRPITVRSCLSGLDRRLWTLANDAELIKLIKTTQTITPAHSCSKTPTYYNPVPREKWSDNQITRRARGTAGGDRAFVDYPASTNTAPMMGVNCTLHATVSEEAFFGTLDLTGFYLGSPMPAPEFINIHAALFSDQLPVDLNITPCVQKDKAGKDFSTPASIKPCLVFARQAYMHVSTSLPSSSNTVTTKPNHARSHTTLTPHFLPWSLTTTASKTLTAIILTASSHACPKNITSKPIPSPLLSLA
jgi:hypothetical protein